MSVYIIKLLLLEENFEIKYERRCIMFFSMRPAGDRMTTQMFKIERIACLFFLREETKSQNGNESCICKIVFALNVE